MLVAFWSHLIWATILEWWRLLHLTILIIVMRVGSIARHTCPLLIYRASASQIRWAEAIVIRGGLGGCRQSLDAVLPWSQVVSSVGMVLDQALDSKLTLTLRWRHQPSALRIILIVKLYLFDLVSVTFSSTCYRIQLHIGAHASIRDILHDNLRLCLFIITTWTLRPQLLLPTSLAAAPIFIVLTICSIWWLVIIRISVSAPSSLSICGTTCIVLRGTCCVRRGVFTAHLLGSARIS